MEKDNKKNKFPYAFFIAIAIILFLMAWFISFKKNHARQPKEVSYYDRTSLIHANPLAGDPGKFDALSCLSQTMNLGNELVTGFIMQQYKILSFPVVIQQGDHFYARIGVDPYDSLNSGNLHVKVSFNDANGNSTLLNETVSANNSDWVNTFYPIDIPLTGIQYGNGELVIECTGKIADMNNDRIMIGQPAIYNNSELRNKNILLIGVDTLRADEASPFGGDPEVTPYLQEFSKECAIFSQARSQAPWTLPSFGSLITGMIPSRAGATGYNEHLGGLTVGNLFLNDNYTTGMVCSNSWLGNPNSGFDYGMESLWYVHQADAEASVDKGIEFIERSKHRNWFLFLHLNDPHVPLEPPLEYVNKIADPDYSGPYQYEFNRSLEWKDGSEIPTPEVLEHVRDLYRAEIAHVDNEIGRLIRYLKDENLYDDTLIVFTSDHGEEYFDHGKYSHGQSQYDELIKAPLMIHGNDFTPGIYSQPVSNLDIVPTIIWNTVTEYTEGIFPGLPLQSYMDPEFTPERIIFGEETGGTIVHKYALQWPYKCIVNFITGQMWLYDMENDPLELINLSDIYPDIAEKLRNEITANLQSQSTVYIVSFEGNSQDGEHVFEGNIHVPGGIKLVRPNALTESDVMEQNGETINFKITNSVDDRYPSKLIVIIPEDSSEQIGMDVYVDGQEPVDRFFPYGNSTPENSGTVVMNVGEFPWPASLPENPAMERSSCYLIVIPGITNIPDTTAPVIHDEETLEQLRSLGYIGN